MRTLIPILLGACVVAPAAWAQGASPEGKPARYDLRAQYVYTTGDKLRITERNEQTQEVRVRSGTKIVERDKGREGSEQRYVLEVLEATPTGDLVKAVRTYESLTIVGLEEPVEVEGVRVLCTYSEEGPTFTPEHGTTVPDALQALLDQGDDGSGPAEDVEALFPADPVSAGSSWTCDPSGVAKALEIEPSHLLSESKVSGTLLEVSPREGATPLLRSKVAISLRASTFGGLTGKGPFVFELTCEVAVPAEGSDVAQELRMQGTVTGRAPSPANDGTLLEFDLEIQLSLTREAL